MKKITALLLNLLMAVSLFGCAQPAAEAEPTAAPVAEATPAPVAEPTAAPVAEPTAEPAVEAEPAALYTAGTYEATVMGHNGNMTVAVTVSENSIDKIEVVNHGESLALGTVAMDHVADFVVKNQSINVDMVSGATVSGAAMLYAVREALTQAGADLSKLAVAVEPEAVDNADVTVDVVIVGSGSAGMAAAAEAGDLGLNAILVEQLGYLGGSSVRTGYLIGGDTKLQAENGMVYPNQKIIDSLISSGAAKADLGLYNEESAKLYGSMAGENIDWLYDMGVNFGVIKYDYQFRGPNAARLGPYLITGLKEHIEKTGVDYRLNTRAESLVQEADGTVTGVVVTAPDGSSYTISAKTVILATGGFFASQDMVAKYNAPFVGYPTDVCIGADGSGHIMAEAAGATFIAMDQANYHGLAAMYNGASRSLQTPLNNGAIVVNKSGERFVNEKSAYEVVAFAILEQEDGYGYCIMDQTMLDFDSIKNDVGLSGMTDMYIKADTLEELAAALEIDAEGLKATVAAYSEYVHNGVDEQFSKPADYLNSDYLTPPYYGIKASPETHTVYGGVVVDTYCHVLDAEGNGIPGLMAIGELAASHVGGTSTNSINIAQGRLAAREAKKAIG